MIEASPQVRELFQNLLRQMRRDAGLTQYEMANDLGVPQSTVSKIESGRRRVDVPELLVLCRVCETDPEAFVATFEERVREEVGSFPGDGGRD